MTPARHSSHLVQRLPCCVSLLSGRAIGLLLRHLLCYLLGELRLCALLRPLLLRHLLR